MLEKCFNIKYNPFYDCYLNNKIVFTGVASKLEKYIFYYNENPVEILHINHVC